MNVMTETFIQNLLEKMKIEKTKPFSESKDEIATSFAWLTPRNDREGTDFGTLKNEQTKPFGNWRSAEP